jgi:hypothetical protein
MLLRIVTPLFIFKFPLPATLASMILDLDAYIAQRAGLRWREYHRIDKILDFWFYIIILLYSLDKPIVPYITGLFIFRSIGQFLSIKTYNTKYLIYFPQAVDLYFLVYLFSLRIAFLKPVLVGEENIKLLLILLALGLAAEFWIHIFHFSLAGFLGSKISWKDNESRRRKAKR